jgi:hypothetical protein
MTEGALFQVGVLDNQPGEVGGGQTDDQPARQLGFQFGYAGAPNLPGKALPRPDCTATGWSVMVLPGRIELTTSPFIPLRLSPPPFRAFAVWIDPSP